MVRDLLKLLHGKPITLGTMKLLLLLTVVVPAEFHIAVSGSAEAAHFLRLPERTEKESTNQGSIRRLEMFWGKSFR